MDAAVNSSDQDSKPAYTTSKQVQAWFLRRSRDLWKTKYADLKAEFKRARQRVADMDRSRAQWRDRAERAAADLERLQTENARLRAAVEATAAREKNDTPARAD
jgi:chromosome segregation ATPase